MIDNTVAAGGGAAETNDIIEWLDKHALQKVQLTLTNSGASLAQISKSFQVPDIAPSKPEKWILIVGYPNPGGARLLFVAATGLNLFGVGETVSTGAGSLSGSLSGTTGTATFSTYIPANNYATFTAYVVAQAGSVLQA